MQRPHQGPELGLKGLKVLAAPQLLRPDQHYSFGLEAVCSMIAALARTWGPQT